MAAAAVLAPPAPPILEDPGNTKIIRPSKELPQNLIDQARATERIPFDPKCHLDIKAPMGILSMKDIGYEGAGISSTAVSEPFSLFTPHAIEQMRAEIFSQPILDGCQYASKLASHMIRGYGPLLAPFIFDAWYSPEVLEMVSKIAGVDLVPALNVDVGHVNISIHDDSVEPNPIESSGAEQHMAAFDWHHDSYPFVCVTMLSDCDGMVGGETAIKTRTGEIIKVRGPAMGTAVVMQGRYIEHQALKAFGGRERISMVTSFRPKSALIRDETVLAGVKPISFLPDLYSQYTSYRLEILEKRCHDQLEKLRKQERGQRDFDIADTRKFLLEQRQFLEAMLIEII